MRSAVGISVQSGEDVKSAPTKSQLCERFDIAIYQVGDVYEIDKAGRPIPDADKGKWFVAAPVGMFPPGKIESIPLSETKERAEALAVEHLGLRKRANFDEGNPDIDMSGNQVRVWSWVNQPETSRPEAAGPGRYSRPLSVRDKVIARTFGKEVRQLRKHAGLTTRELARLIGISQPAVVMLENNSGQNIELRLVFDLAEAFNVSPKHFLEKCMQSVQAAQQDNGQLGKCAKLKGETS